MAKKKSTNKQNMVVRKNAPSGIDERERYHTAMSRYTDPLILMKYHNKQLAEVREVVAEADAIASVLTHAFSESAAAKMIKFYESDQLDSPEIMMDLRAMLKIFKFQEYMKEVILRGQTHGWWIIYPFVDPESKIPMCEIYSEYECKPEYITYDLQNNIQLYNINFQPRVGFSRRTNLHWVYRKFQPNQVLHGTRGRWNYGFGYSSLEGSWDAITKLREESHTNAFKQKILPFVRVPDEWTDEQIDDFMKVLAKTDEISAMVMRGYINPNDGTMTDLPAVSWATPANNTPAKSSQGSGGSVSDLSSEWSRLTGSTRRSVAYFVGGGALSASRAAAGVDSLDDVDEDIIDFNQYLDEFIIPFVKWFAAVVGYPLPDSFTVKGWWEWTRDEALYQKVLMEQQKQEQAMAKIQDDQQSNADRKNLLTEMKDRAILSDTSDLDKELQARVNRHHNNHPDQSLEESLMEVVAEVAYERRINYATESITTQYNHNNKMDYNDLERMALMVQTIAANKNNIVPNTIVPVNSISGNTEYTMLEKDDAGNENLWVKFKSPYNWYRYQERGEDMGKIADDIYMRGGEAVWDQLRGLPNAPRDENGKLPKGVPRAPAASRDPAPLAGRPHDAYGIPYQGMGSQGPKGALFTDMVAEGKADLETQLTGEPAAPDQPQGPPNSTMDSGFNDYGVLSNVPNAPPITIQGGSDMFESMNETQSTEPSGTIQDLTPRTKLTVTESPNKLKDLFMEIFKKTKIGRIITAGVEIGKGLFGSDKTSTSKSKSKSKTTTYTSSQGIFDNSTTSTANGTATAQIDHNWQTSERGSRYYETDSGTKVYEKRNIGIPLEKDENYDSKLEYHPLLQEYNSVSGMRKNLHIGYEKAHEMLDHEEKDCPRWNLAALATAMHTANPFIYKIGDNYRIEYICPDSLRQLEGEEVPFGLWHNLDDEESSILPDWQIIGSYKVKMVDGQKDLSEIHYNEDWEEKAVAVIDRLKQTKYYQDLKVKDWLDNYVENVKKGIHGDISTGIVTDVKYNKEKNKWVQTNIKLKSVSAVPIGNCTKPYCSTKNV